MGMMCSGVGIYSSLWPWSAAQGGRMGVEICGTIVPRICNEDIVIRAENQYARASGLFEGDKGYVSMKQFRAGRNE